MMKGPTPMQKSYFLKFLALALVAACLARSIYDWFFVDDGVRYFTGDRSHILLLLASIAIGTPILLGYMALSAEWQHRIKLWLFGILAIGATGYAARIAYMMVPTLVLLRETGSLWYGLLVMLLPCLMAAGLWWAFSRIRNRKPI